MSKVITFSRVFQKSHPRAGEPTFFVEKIVKALDENKFQPLQNDIYNFFDEDFYNEKAIPKYHTIRSGNRWKVRDKFSPRIWSGKPYASKMITISPDIEIKNIYPFELTKYEFILNGQKLGLKELEVVAKNDGLSSEDFEYWFNSKDFKGQVICWSDIKLPHNNCLSALRESAI